ncbi:CRISPR-associated DxTHG motif protein [Nitritalea halalkaliphila]|uniref:CRISPR-associated DxTHG motif protein n=1 Tax=Nitritalea halalkaliphila TaxID=590849 RepID=UPI00030CFB68|nr:TM1812 family CRISPR-associated protein [Nitritalea halalkaliphila]
MNRKVLLSFLGTSNYVSCNYFTEGNPEEKIENVRYIQEAIFKLYCTNFTANDQVLLLLTELAEKMNFLDDGQWSPQSKSYSASNEGLKSRFQQLQEEGFKFTLNTQRIKEGFSQEEIWSIFETIADQIQEGDTIILDITHAFRFLP